LLQALNYEKVFTLNDVPKQWIQKFELFYPDLPGYPIVYVHAKKDGKRVYGFPASVSYEIRDENNCDVHLTFISNINLEQDSDLDQVVQVELENRFGVSDKFGIEELKSCCKGEKRFEDFFEEVWKYVSLVNGKYLPYGRFYEKIFSIVRFVSAYDPKTGRQSEMRMLYNFMSIFGEPVKISDNWKHLHFFVIPTYSDVKGEEFSDFPRFGKLFGAMKKIWDKEFTKTISLEGRTFQSLNNAWEKKKDLFIQNRMKPLQEEGVIDASERFQIERLVDAFNRYSWRSAFFIWNIMNIQTNDYDTWNKDDFVNFYLETKKSDTTTQNRKTVGVSQKVVACFLQQGFGKKEIIPVDTWIKSFYKYALGIESEKKFFETFDEMAKLERVIWALAQSKKTNITTFFDMLWCIRYGVTGNKELRGANPIACYECKLKTKCPGFSTIKSTKILVRDQDTVLLENIVSEEGNYLGQKIQDGQVVQRASQNNCKFICLTENRVPKKIFVEKGTQNNRYWKLIDEFSGYILDSNDDQLSQDYDIISTNDMMNDLGPFRPRVDLAEVIDE